MTRKVWLFGVVLGVAGVAAWVFWPAGEPGGTGPGTDAPAPTKSARRAPRPFRLETPDQPGWTLGPTAEDYRLEKKAFVASYRATRRLGEPEPVEQPNDLARVAPFTVAALPLEDSEGSEHEMEEVAQMQRIVQTLRDARIPAFGNPVLVYVPSSHLSPEAWEEEAEILVGIPVAAAADLPSPLRKISVPGGEAITAPASPRVRGSDVDWPALVRRAADIGRRPAGVHLVRYSGWRERPAAVIMMQPMLFLEPATPAGASNPDP